MGKITFNRPDEPAMVRLLADERHTAAGIILRLAWKQGLTREEMQRLTWADIAPEEEGFTCRIGLSRWRRKLRPACWIDTPSWMVSPRM